MEELLQHILLRKVVDRDPAHGIHNYVSLTTSIRVWKKATIHNGPFVWMNPCLHGMEKMEIFVAMACHMYVTKIAS